MQNLKVLIIDDHPQIAQSFRFALAKVTENSGVYNFTITEATTIDMALGYLSNASDSFYDLIFLDIKLPQSENGKFLSGEDLGIEIRKIMPKAKIIVSTTYNDNFRINNIMKSVDREGFLIKNDLTPKALTHAIEEVLEDAPAYSKTVKILLRKFATNDVSLDKVDRQILYQLSIGTKMLDLPNVIPMSIGGIERRKRQLKEVFDITKLDDKALVEAARAKGFI